MISPVSTNHETQARDLGLWPSAIRIATDEDGSTIGKTTMRRELDNVPAWARHPFQDDGVHVNPLDYMGLQHAALKAVDRKVDRLKLALQEVSRASTGRTLALAR